MDTVHPALKSRHSFALAALQLTAFLSPANQAATLGPITRHRHGALTAALWEHLAALSLPLTLTLPRAPATLLPPLQRPLAPRAPPRTGLTHVDMVMSKETPEFNRGFAFVEFYNSACAQQAKNVLSHPDFK